MALFSSLEAAAFDSPIMQKEKERERERESDFSSHQSKSGRKCGAQTKRPRTPTVSYSRGRKGVGGGVAKHAMTNDSWNGKEREKNKNGLIFSPPSFTDSTPLPRAGLEKSAVSQSCNYAVFLLSAANRLLTIR